MTIAKGDRFRFRTTSDDPTLMDGNGRIVTVMRIIDTPDNEHDEEVLPMYRVAFLDPADKDWIGWLSDIEVWDDELEALP